MSDESRYERLHPQAEKPKEPLDNKQLTAATEELTTKVDKQDKTSGSHRVALIVAYILIVVSIGLHFLPSAHPKPTKVEPSAPTAALTSEVQGYRAQVTALQDTVASLRKIAARAEEKATEAVGQAESYGGRVDEIHKQLNGLEINGVIPAKK